MLEYVRYSKSSSRFSKTIAVWSLLRISKTPSTGSRQPRSMSRSAALRSGLLARNASRTGLAVRQAVLEREPVDEAGRITLVQHFAGGH
jgi:hypothetical protein